MKFTLRQHFAYVSLIIAVCSMLASQWALCIVFTILGTFWKYREDWLQDKIEVYEL